MTATIAKSESGAAGSASAALLRRLLPLAVVFLATQFLVRLTLTVRAGSDYADDTLGFALPFLLIGYVPAFRRLLPKPGGWMETFRRILAVPMFLTALGLAWVLGHQTQANGVVVGIGAAMLLAFGLWLTGLRQRAFKGAAWVPAALVALLVAVGGIAMLPGHAAPAAVAAQDGVQPFDEAKLAALQAQHKPVFLYFTADWCLSCKVNEKAAIERAETQDAFRKAGVVTMVGDWTDGDAKIGKFLETHGRSGVPLYLWYAPGSSTPKELPQILTPSMLAGLAGA